jgi:hypothetical protein
MTTPSRCIEEPHVGREEPCHGFEEPHVGAEMPYFCAVRRRSGRMVPLWV